VGGLDEMIHVEREDFQRISDDDLKKVIAWLKKEKAEKLIPYVEDNSSGVQEVALEIFNKGEHLSAGDFNAILYYAIDME